MAILTGATVTIPVTQMKVRWREDYASEGINKALGMLDPGCYRGGYLEAQAAPNHTVRIAAVGEQDHSWLWTDLATGTALVVRYPAGDITIDLASAFTGGGGTMPTTTTFYVYLDCAYSTGATTAGHFYVDTTAPAGNAVAIGRIVVPGGAATILDTYINRSATYRKVAPLDRVVLRKAAAVFTPSGSPLAFHLTGKVYLPGGTAGMSDKAQYVQLAGAGSWYVAPVAYVGSDNGVIYTTNLWTDAAGTTPIVADSEGFVLDPYVTINTSKTSDTSPPAGVAWYWTRATQRDFVTNDGFLEAFEPVPHADQVQTRNVAGTPTAIASSTVGGAVATLLAAVNDRISTIAPETAPAAEVLLWRSHGITSDSAVTGTTISLYWGTSLGFMAMVGGYVDGSNFYYAPVTPSGVVVALRISPTLQTGPMLLAKHGSFGGGLAWANLANWSAYTRVTNVLGASGFDIGGATFNISAIIANVVGLLTLDSGVTLAGGQIALSNDGNYVSGGYEPGTAGNDDCCLVWQGGGSSAVKSRIYFGASGVLMLTTNAQWIPDGRWMPDSIASDAKMLSISTLLGFQMFTKRRLTAGFASGWAILAWDGAISWLDSVIAGQLSPVASGSGNVEVVPLGFGHQNQTGVGTIALLYSEIHKTYRGIVSTITYQMSNNRGVSTYMPATIDGTTANGVGGMAWVTTDSILNGDYAYWNGIAVVAYV